MIRLGNMQDISQIETLVEEAKKLMKEFFPPKLLRKITRKISRGQKVS